MKSRTSTNLGDWYAAQGADIGPNRMNETVELGPIYSDSWLRDPKHLVFALARYKFVAKMLDGTSTTVAEVGAGDAWASAIVGRGIYGHVDHYDIAPLTDRVQQYDVMSGRLPKPYPAIYALDVFEHVASGERFFRNLADSLNPHGKLIVGTPSLEGQDYASQPSRRLHINCVSGETLRLLASHYFHHVFMFGMNDEVVHTGFLPMSHYLFAVCAEPIR